MKVLWLLVFLVTLGFTFLHAAASAAQARPLTRLVGDEPLNECGFTLGDLVDGKLLALASHPLSPVAMSQIGDTVHQAPKMGVQFELLTPGDIGATVHFRW